MSRARFVAIVLVAFAAARVAAVPIDGEDLIDPTRPYGTVDEVPRIEVADNRFTVEFIRAGGSSPVAVINGRRVGIGETVNGAMVLGITRDFVTLIIDGQEEEVRLNNNVSKTTVNGL